MISLSISISRFQFSDLTNPPKEPIGDVMDWLKSACWGWKKSTVFIDEESLFNKTI